MREWARILKHPVADYLNRTPFWQPIVWNPTDGSEAIKAQEHYTALQLVKEDMTGIWIVDGDGKSKVGMSASPEKSKLNRISWRRYETESYLVHPAALARYINQHSGKGGEEAVRKFLAEKFSAYFGAGAGSQIVDEFIKNPDNPSTAVERLLSDKDNKARTVLIGGILNEGGVHGLDYTKFNEIAAMMEPKEIHPEVKEKLDFIQQAFGL